MNEKFKTLPIKEDLGELMENYWKDQYECPERMSNWLDKFQGNNNIHIPKTVIVDVPKDIVKAFCFDRPDRDELTIKSWIETDFIPVLNKSFPNEKEVFVKNGCFSNKFDFNNSCRLTDFSAISIFKHLFNIEQRSLAYDIMGDIEFAIRQYIEPDNDLNQVSTIYNGMPLRPEIRVFYDFTNHKFLYNVQYWDYETMVNSLEGDDLKTFKSYWPVLEDLYKEANKYYLPKMINWLNTIEFEGIYSVDFMVNDGVIWMIDIARGFRSAYWDSDKIK